MALREFGGDGPPALLVHGLAGHAEEWSATAAWLGRDRRVFALDLRGHGRSERRRKLVSPRALVEDVCFGLEWIGDRPALLRVALERWPVPFADSEAAETYFGGPSARAEAWVQGLRPAADGLRPRFEPAVVTRMLREVAAGDCWEDWSRIACPTLVVRGGQGELPDEEVGRMLADLPAAGYAELPDVGHEVHLEQPALWSDAVSGFLTDAAIQG